jgi:hypothetical protein
MDAGGVETAIAQELIVGVKGDHLAGSYEESEYLAARPIFCAQFEHAALAHFLRHSLSDFPNRC